MPVTLTESIRSFVQEWIRGLADVRAAINRKDFGSVARDLHILSSVEGGGNYINGAGYSHLNKAADLLLQRTGLDARVSRRTARQAIVESFNVHLPKGRKKGFVSEDAIIQGSIARLRATPSLDGEYVFPLVFAPSAKASSFYIGPLRIASKQIFLQEYQDVLERKREQRQDEFRMQLLQDWASHLEGYDHLMVVTISGYERDMAWVRAREAAEFFLNLVRMMFNHSTTKNIRIGGGFSWETKQASLIVSPDREAHFSSSAGPWGSVLDGTWTDQFDESLGWFSQNLGSYALWLLSGTSTRDPILERLRYANTLIAEAYSEPHDHFKLVRVISALEALMVLGGQDKAHNLALNCAYVGGWGDHAAAVQIYDAVRDSYRLRSAVVHGDGAASSDVRGAFYRLERNILRIFLGQMALLSQIARDRSPQSVSALRREFNARVEEFYWCSELSHPL